MNKNGCNECMRQTEQKCHYVRRLKLKITLAKNQRTLSSAAVLILAGILQVEAVPTWYDVTFTGIDIWTYSADNAAEARADQAAPRRYRDWTQPAGSEVQATTYGLSGGLPTTGFGAWAPSSGFAFDEINLWNAGPAGGWGENYVSVGTPHPDHGFSSWKVIQSPVGWSSGIVAGGDPWSSDETHAFPVWRSSGDSDKLGLANMTNSSFVFEFQVLISNPETAFESDGTLRVFFGGFSDDNQSSGPDNYAVSGVMTLTANQVPDAGSSMMLLGIALAGLGAVVRRRRSN